MNKCPHYDVILGTCYLYFVLEDKFDCLEEVNAKCKDIKIVSIRKVINK